MRFILATFLLFALNGCASNVSQSLTQTVTAVSQGSAKQVFWLEEKVNEPQTLTELNFNNDIIQFEAQYRWDNGEIREIEQKGKIEDENGVKAYRLIARYNESGQAIYQQYRVNDEIYPLKDSQLKSYYQAAKQAYEQAKFLTKNKKIFFQGYVQNQMIVECGEQEAKNLYIKEDSYKKNISPNKKYYVAALGMRDVGRISLEELFSLKEANTACYEKPLF